MSRVVKVIGTALLVMSLLEASSIGIDSLAAASQPETSSHWSGFVTEDPSQADVRGVFGSWTVPTVTCANGETSSSLTWVGIGGALAPSAASKTDETLYQTGTASNCLNGVPEYVAFVEDEGAPNQFATNLGGYFINPDLVILGCKGRVDCTGALSVVAGDTITAAVVDHNVYTRWTITDVRQGRKLWSHTDLWLTKAHRHSAECIEEDPLVGSKTASIGTLANFGTVTFSDCRASDTKGKLWSIEGQPLPMGWNTIDYSIQQQGWIVASPDGESLSITWLGPKSPIPDFPSGLPSAIVSTPSGYEAATWDQQGNIDFWKLIDGQWTMQGKSRYPVLPNDVIDTSVTGALLSNMSDAVFIARGAFTGDGSGSAVAFTNGAHGWGTIAGTAIGQPLQATGQAATDNTTPGLALAIDYRDGFLDVSYHNDDFPTASGTWFDLNIEWAWNGYEFVARRDNIFTVEKVAAPNIHKASSLPYRTCPTSPANGSYLGYWGVGEGDDTVAVTFTQNNADSGFGVGTCTFDAGQNVPLIVQATLSEGETREWIRAPIWILFDLTNSEVAVEPILSPGLAKFPSSYYVKGGSPIFIPSGAHLRGIAPQTTNYGIATIHAGKLVGLTLLQN
jgi:hypothetical protein